ncbi:MAG: endonuclease/exonuclease/phosphatase family protein [Lysobacterales bacterium]
MNNNNAVITPVYAIRGPGPSSAMAGQVVTVRGVVTGVSRHGFFIQNEQAGPDPHISDALFVFSLKWPAPMGALLDVSGPVQDYVKEDNGKPVTQIKMENVRVLKKQGPEIKPFELTADNVPGDTAELAVFLNGLESMLVTIAPGQTFIAPSNPFGDYVLALDAEKPLEGVIRTAQGGVLAEHENPLRWYPGFRISHYADAPLVNVGGKLSSRITGPLNYRVEAYQVAVSHPIEVENADVPLSVGSLRPETGHLTIMTMNGFNLDMHVESPDRVKNPGQDIDDDWGDGRFLTLASAVVKQANVPDIVALQEIQDNDGAEMSLVVDASSTYQGLIKTIRQLCGVEYHWVDIPPEVGADGGQPGGSIRNGYLYHPDRVDMVKDSARLIGATEPAFEDSRKPLVVHFREKITGHELVCVNVHLASKRHQFSIFAPEQPGFDARLPIRVRQAEIIADQLDDLRRQGLDYYVTGDFNDTEESETLAAIVADENVNLVKTLAPDQRYDYNHRGKLQVLMHGIVPKSLAEGHSWYEIIHGNELLGIKPGRTTDKPSDHAYVLAKIKL